MTGIAARARLRRTKLGRALALATVLACAQAGAQEAAPPEVGNSGMDAPLFYQLLVGEMQLSGGSPAGAFEILLDAARRQGDDQLFQRAVEIALQSRAGDQALAAAQAWRTAKPRATAPLRYQTQILLALNRHAELAEPLQAWLALAPADERPGLLASLPPLLQRVPDRRQALDLGTRVLAPYRDAADTRTAARVALGRLHLAAGDNAQAANLARQAQADDAGAPSPALLALDLLATLPAVEPQITQYLAQAGAEPLVRLSYVRALTSAQRYAEALQQVEQVTRERPSLSEPWLMLGALRLELKQPQPAEAALQQYITLASAASAASTATAAESDDESPDDDDHRGSARDTAAGITQAWLLLAQAAEQRGDLKAAEAWLAKVDNPQRALEVQSRRASLLMRQGKVKEARALIQSAPERTGDDARAKVLAEAQLLRDAKRWREAAEVLASGNKRFADDIEMLYEQAMIDEKLERFADMERQLRRVIALKPDHPHAHNALGYSLADRGQRLPEARALIRKALDLQPGDPFITDSLGWVEYRMGNRGEAIRLLRSAYGARPDTEIAAHLGEVLWADGRKDEALKLWREAGGRDAGNEVLRDTLARLKVSL